MDDTIRILTQKLSDRQVEDFMSFFRLRTRKSAMGTIIGIPEDRALRICVKLTENILISYILYKTIF